jgi:carbamoyltransferase
MLFLDREMEKLSAYEQELAQTLVLAPDCRRARISHHLAHLYSFFQPSSFEDAAVMIVDGQGRPAKDFTEQCPEARNVAGQWREVSSFYYVDCNRIECLGKQLWDCDDDRLVGLRMFYFLMTETMLPGEGNEGKVMGLAPFGDPTALGLPPLEVDGASVTIPERWREALRERSRFRYAADDPYRFSDTANLAAAGQRAFEDALLEVARWLYTRTGAESLCFGAKGPVIWQHAAEHKFILISKDADFYQRSLIHATTACL